MNGITTVGEYVVAHARSYLAQSLKTDYHSADEIVCIGSGLILPNGAKSNLARALTAARVQYPGARIDYTIGGRADRSRTKGYWWAVVLVV